MSTYNMCTPVAAVGIDQPSYTVPEDVGQLEVWINYICEQIAPDQECQFTVTTTDGSAESEFMQQNYLKALTIFCVIP